ncbi:MAG TPA: protein phosphatase 2C domain-containing protein [Rugosimonospora sp.]|nr:protein phosphatase 2C domain-containing protein [Rugosimonospora sp.]
MTLTLRSVVVSDLGKVRTNNEDAAHAGSSLIAVADGMGGLPAGDLASGIVMRALKPLDKRKIPPGGAAGILRAAVEAANDEVRVTAAADPAREGMGTTVTALLRDGDALALLHIGDSRCYRLRDGELVQITRDDTFVQSLVDEGVISRDEARVHPHKSLVTQALQGHPLEPTELRLALRAGDRYLLCSDGLSDVVRDETIGETLDEIADRKECAGRLIDLAYRAGAPDNITVVVADVVES